MIENVKKSVSLFKKKYKLTDITEKALYDTLDLQGYTVIYFNAILNDENVSRIVTNLKLHNQIITNKGFTYSNDKYRLVFVNEDLSEEERLIVMAHEQGHIFCEHMNHQPVIGQDVKQEHEANEFAHYLLHPGMGEMLKNRINKHKKLFAVVCTAILLLAIGLTVFFVASNRSEYGDYYITATGKKYHKKDCVFIKDKDDVHKMTREEFDSGEYDPCKTCLPDD